MSTEVHMIEKAHEQAIDTSVRQQFSNPDAKHYHDMKNGALGGAVVGLGYGIATLATIGFAAIPGVFEAMVLLGFAILGGVLFGGIIGSTGLFSKSH